MTGSGWGWVGWGELGWEFHGSISVLVSASQSRSNSRELETNCAETKCAQHQCKMSAVSVGIDRKTSDREVCYVSTQNRLCLTEFEDRLEQGRPVSKHFKSGVLESRFEQGRLCSKYFKEVFKHLSPDPAVFP